MSKIHRIEVVEVEGTGAGYGEKPHVYGMGKAVIWSRRLSTGLKMAKRVAAARVRKDLIAQGVLSGSAIPVDGWVKIDNVMVEH
jgi:hypothetical protein